MEINELKEILLNNNVPKTIGIILDGNGRWAKEKGMPRTMGHAEGIKTLVEIAEASRDVGVKNLIVYAFSTENWNRPTDEVNFLMKALVNSFDLYIGKIIKNKTHIHVIGEKDNLPAEVLETINKVEDTTKEFDNLHIYLCFNYGSRKEIEHAVKEIAIKYKNNEISLDDINQNLISNNLYTAGLPDIDLLIRTSGELRLSNFMLWQLSYAEFSFPKTYWPDFHTKEYYECLLEYLKRDRRFGSIK